MSLCQRKPVKHNPDNNFFVPLDDGNGGRAYLAVNKKGNSQLEALDQTPPLENLSRLLSGDERRRHAMVTSFIEAAKENGESLGDIIQFVSDVYHRNKSIGPKPKEDEDGWLIDNLLHKNDILNDKLDSPSSIFLAVGKKLSFEENHQADNYNQYQSQYDQNHQAMPIHQAMP